MGCAGSRAAPRAAGAQLPPPPLASDARHLRVKLVLLGDSGVGKSCIVMRFVRGSFDADSKVTVGAACACLRRRAAASRALRPRAAVLAQVVASEDGATTKFEIWHAHAAAEARCSRHNVAYVKTCSQGHRGAGALRLARAAVLQARRSPHAPSFGAAPAAARTLTRHRRSGARPQPQSCTT